MGKEDSPRSGEPQVLRDSPVGEKHISCMPQEETEDCEIDSNLGEIAEETEKVISYESLPETIKKRINALRALQLKIVDTDAEFYRKAFELEFKFEKIQKDLFEKRFRILSGEHEPTDEECDYPLPDEDPKIVSKKRYPFYDENVKGIPDFWLTVFKNSSMLGQIFKEKDEPILSHLQDIKLKLHESPYGYTLEFHFSENEYFTNKVLTKYYELTFDPNKDYPFDFDGTAPKSSKGCKINWKEGKDITSKAEKEEEEKEKDMISKTAYGDTFFNFFNSVTVEADDSDNDDKANILYDDFELGNVFKDRIIPKAVLYYTGEEFDDEENEYENLDDDQEEIDDVKEVKEENKEEDENKEEKDENEVRSIES